MLGGMEGGQGEATHILGLSWEERSILEPLVFGGLHSKG